MNKNRIEKIIFILVSIVFITMSCSFDTKEAYLQNFSDFISDIENNAQTYTEEDWKTKEIEYNKFIGEKYEQFRTQFTDEEQQTIGKLKARYFKIVLKSGLKQFEEDIKEGAKQIEGFIEELK